MKKLIKHFGSGVKLANALGIAPNYVYMCASTKSRAMFSRKLAERAVKISGGVTTIESIRRKSKAKKPKKRDNHNPK